MPQDLCTCQSLCLKCSSSRCPPGWLLLILQVSSLSRLPPAQNVGSIHEVGGGGRQGSFILFTASSQCLPAQVLQKYVLNESMTGWEGAGAKHRVVGGILRGSLAGA